MFREGSEVQVQGEVRGVGTERAALVKGFEYIECFVGSAVDAKSASKIVREFAGCCAMVLGKLKGMLGSGLRFMVAACASEDMIPRRLERDKS